MTILCCLFLVNILINIVGPTFPLQSMNDKQVEGKRSDVCKSAVSCDATLAHEGQPIPFFCIYDDCPYFSSGYFKTENEWREHYYLQHSYCCICLCYFSGLSFAQHCNEYKGNHKCNKCRNCNGYSLFLTEEICCACADEKWIDSVIVDEGDFVVSQRTRNQEAIPQRGNYCPIISCRSHTISMKNESHLIKHLISQHYICGTCYIIDKSIRFFRTKTSLIQHCIDQEPRRFYCAHNLHDEKIHGIYYCQYCFQAKSKDPFFATTLSTVNTHIQTEHFIMQDTKNMLNVFKYK